MALHPKSSNDETSILTTLTERAWERRTEKIFVARPKKARSRKSGNEVAWVGWGSLFKEALPRSQKPTAARISILGGLEESAKKGCEYEISTCGRPDLIDDRL
jgi:hypothetical protein